MPDNLSVVALSAAKNAQSRYRGNDIALMGDSLTGLSFDAATTGIGSGVWVHQLLMRSNGALQYVYNAGISGQRTDQMLARFDTDIVNKRPSLCTIMGGTNDVKQGILPAVALANIEAMVLKCFPARITPILATIPPLDEGKVTEVLQVNAGIYKIARKYGLDVLDFYSLLVDPATSKYKSGYSTDGIHPGTTPVKLMGQYAAEQLLPKLPAFRTNVPAVNNAPNNLLKNSLFLTDANADGVADNWTMYGTGVATSSLTTGDATIKGSWMTMDKTDAASTKTYSQAISTGFKAGDVIAFTGRVKTTVEGTEMPVTVQLAYTGASGMMRPLNNWKTDNNGIFYVEGVVPTGATALTVTMTAGAGTGKAEYAQFAVYNLSNEVF
ncbi:GDSL-type esterase/lipase family protein [Paenibacillus sp. ACRRY]|uniref:GDSL-type esterase/lipase family protein n=1 Tax=Paenibacillus sp. ACRRY TaxID=2918208 RepID=UPI001EF5D3E3|nr:GDSL-type esterase/lipase family protein [Paenibacillus sp. ACRRY]MCG7385089.1 GDSL-type esterase/lipase family protein [Paenibacillus sp. ACRRY]